MSRRRSKIQHGCFSGSDPAARYNKKSTTAIDSMKPTDTSDPTYFHRVVDCQWGCPAHTDVPEYIRMIAQGRYTDAYMLNRRSKLFTAILDRL